MQKPVPPTTFTGWAFVMDRGNGVYASYASRLHFFAVDRSVFTAAHRTARAKSEKLLLAPVCVRRVCLRGGVTARGSRGRETARAPSAAAGTESRLPGGCAKRVYGDDVLAGRVRHPHLLVWLHQGLRQPERILLHGGALHRRHDGACVLDQPDPAVCLLGDQRDRLLAAHRLLS